MLLQDGHHAAAAEQCRAVLAERADPKTRAEANSLLGLCLMPDDPVAALSPLREAASLDPDEPMFHFNLGQGLEKAGEQPAAVEAYRTALRSGGNVPQIAFAFARGAARLGLHQEAIAVLEPLARARKAPRVVSLLYAKCLYADGAAFAAFDALAGMEPAGGAAWTKTDFEIMHLLLKLANQLGKYDYVTQLAPVILAQNRGDTEALRTFALACVWQGQPGRAAEIFENYFGEYGATPELLSSYLVHIFGPKRRWVDAAIDATESHAVPDKTKRDLHFALAQHRFRTGEALAAMDHARRAHALDGRSGGLTVDQLGEALRFNIAVCGGPSVRADSDAAVSIIYIGGAPRSGGSLIQSILCASPAMVSVGERAALLPYLIQGVSELSALDEKGRAAKLTELQRADARGLRRTGPATSVFVDKTPYNVLAAGGLSRIHPAARFIFPLRDPESVALSIYLRRFPDSYSFARQMKGIFAFLSAQADAITAWKRLGLSMRVIDFDGFAKAPEVASRDLFEWIGVYFDPEILTPERRTEPVPTYSASQVRAPIAPSNLPAGYQELFEEYRDTITAIRERQRALLNG